MAGKSCWQDHAGRQRGLRSSFLSLAHACLQLVLLSALLPGMVGVARGQVGSESLPAPAGISHSFAGVGLRAYVRDAWGSVGVTVENATDQPADVLSVMYFELDPNRQYGRQMHVPARSRRSSWFDVQTPSEISPTAGSVEIRTMLYARDPSGGVETLIPSRSGQVLGDALLSVVNERPTTGVIADADDEESLAAVIAMRLVRGLTRNVAALDGEILPPAVECLDGLDQLVIMSDRIAGDAAGMTAVRQWLQAGGRLWIMLDQVDPATAVGLLGGAFRVSEVDRLDLLECTVKREFQGGFAPEELPLQFEDPVEFVRVLAPDAQILQTIDGWPASFELRLGTGYVLCTTLEGRGWVRARTDQDPTPVAAERSSLLVANAALGDIGFRFSRIRAEPALRSEDFREYLSEQIGYEIIGRESVLLVLVGFWICLLGPGVWLLRRNQLEHLGWIGPVVVAAASVILIGQGNSSRQAVPDSLVRAQFVEVAEGSRQISASGMVALYHQAALSATPEAVRGGVFVPEAAGQSERVHRKVRTDVDRWQHTDVLLPEGLLFAPFRQSRLIEHPISAKAMFGPEEIRVRMETGPFRNLSDPVIVTPGHGGMYVRSAEQGDSEFLTTAADVLRPGQFLSATVLTDEQRRREGVLQKLLSVSQREAFPLRPMLLTWADPFEDDFLFSTAAQPRGAALLAIPLEIEPTPPGTRLRIPSPFLSYEPVGASGAYDTAGHRWVSTNLARHTMLRFQVPEALLPLRLDQAVLNLSISAPSRTVDIVARSGTETVLLKSFFSPVGQLRVATDRPEVLVADSDGGLYFGVTVSEPRGAEHDPARGAVSAFDWVIHSLQLDVTGQAQDQAENPR